VKFKPPKIAYVIAAPLPTSKAYGITAKETVEILLKHKFEVKVISAPGNYFDSGYRKLSNVQECFPASPSAKFFIKFGNRGNRRLNTVSWTIGTTINVINSFKILKRFTPQVIWVRNPFVALILLNRFRKVSMILEIHGTSGKIFYNFLKFYRDRLRFYPINDLNKEFLLRYVPTAIVEIAPMCVRAENIASKYDCVKYLKSLRSRNFQNIRIGYVGRIEPNGYSKGVIDLINLAEYFFTNKIKASVTIIGADKKEIFRLQRYLSESNIPRFYLKLMPHMSHSSAIRTMKKLDVLVLPSYESPTYIGMPIKLLEYISTGRITIVSDSPLYNSLFKGDFRPFMYKPHDVVSLNEQIQIALQSKDLKLHLFEGIKFVADFTWEKRTLNIMKPYI
jgi:glycosyltransferase involved in cell wall biosynthesis